jgi:hypothetical protein
MKELLHSSKIRAILWILGGIIILFIVFGVGAMVGHRQAAFLGRFGDNYYRNFYGGPIGHPSFNMHGVAGEVIDISSSSLSVKDFDGDEHSVAIFPDTAIREDNRMITMGDVRAGDMITVIGSPNGAGQIEARFVRVFEASSSMPLPPPFPGTSFN